MLGSSWVAAQLVGSQEGLCSMKLVMVNSLPYKSQSVKQLIKKSLVVKYEASSLSQEELIIGLGILN
jgi:hypothetical protein